MSEQRRDAENERKVALTVLKLGGAVVSAAALTAAAGWAGRRLKFEHTAQRYTDVLAYLESTDAEHHHGIIRRVTAASLLMPGGATVERLKNLAKRDDRHGPAGEAIHHLVQLQVIEAGEAEGRQMLRPTQDFMKMLLDKDSPSTPKLLATAQAIYENFEYEDLRPFIIDPDVLDQRPLG